VLWHCCLDDRKGIRRQPWKTAHRQSRKVPVRQTPGDSAKITETDIEHRCHVRETMWDSPLASGAPLLYKFFLPRPRLHFCPRGASRPRPWSRGLHHWYNLVPANGWWCLATGKVTVGLASHWPRVTDSGFPPTGSRPRSERWAPNYVLLCSMVDFTFTFILGK